MQRKNDLQEEIKESNELKSLAKKVVNAEIQGTDQAAVIKVFYLIIFLTVILLR